MTDFKLKAPQVQFEQPVQPNEKGYLMETASIPEIRMEWHPKRLMLYWVPKWIKPERAIPVSDRIMNPQEAQFAAQIFCQGYLAGKQQTRKLLV